MMAKIVYGVSGEGSGHSSRSREMAKHLVEKGYEVKIVSYDHILVYLSFGFDSFLEVMKNLTREKFIVYGYNKAQEDENLIFKTFSKQGFLDDLASSKAVIATAGFTLMTESFYYRKPLMALPMKGQFEQEINGILMAELGYGKNLTAVTLEAVGDFLYCLPDYRSKLKHYPVEDNSKIKFFRALFVKKPSISSKLFPDIEKSEKSVNQNNFLFWPIENLLNYRLRQWL